MTAIRTSTLFTAHAARLRRQLAGLGVRASDVDDALQDTFVVVARRLPSFEGRSSIESWLFGICLRVASDWRRKAFVRRETALADAEEPTHEPDLADVIGMQQARQKLHQAVAALDDDKRDIYLRHELDEQPMPAVAGQLRVNVQTAYARLYAARRRMSQFVAREQLAAA